MAEFSKQLFEGSFRGVRFLTTKSLSNHGRRVAQHQYPQRDAPYNEDLGLSQRIFNLEVMVVGSDWTRQRDNLIAACETEGTGTLVHPYYGEKRVNCTACLVSEDQKTGRMAKFVLTFVEQGEKNTGPAQIYDTAAKVNQSANTLFSQAKDALEKGLQTANLPSFVITEGGQVIRAYVQTFRQTLKYNPVYRTVSAVSRVLDDLENDSDSLMSLPDEMSDDIQKALDSISNDIDDPKRQVAIYKDLSNFGNDLPVVAETTSTRSIQARNQEILVATLRAYSTVYLINATTKVTFSTYDEANKVREDINAAFETQFDAAIKNRANTTINALYDARATVIRHITERAPLLSRIATVPVLTPTPGLALAYDLYENLAREQEIIDRNSVKHPAFIFSDALNILVRNDGNR